MFDEKQALEFIHGIARFGSKPGLRRVTMLLERMGNPQNRLKFIHVAGSDGKGSTCAMLSHIFTKAGYRTGLYISPYVVDFRERIQLNNEMIPPEELARSTAAVKEHWDALDALGEPPTEFEVVVAVAMDYFLRSACDLVILEVGMGGRFDATNVIATPLCSVITHISLDHMEYLGDTLEQIAFEKCGIIKAGGVTVSYPKQDAEALAVIMERCAEEGNELYRPNHAEMLRADLFGSDFCYGEETFHVPLPGPHQIWNAVTAIETARAVSRRGFPITPEQLQNGIASTRFPSRIEVLGREPLVLLDGGHNPAEARALAATLELLRGRRIHAVIGMLGDKDVDGALAAILPHCSDMTAIAPNYPRAMPPERLAEVARSYCADVRSEGDSRRALRDAYGRCTGDDVLLCCGSLYLAAEIRPFLMNLVENTGNK